MICKASVLLLEYPGIIAFDRIARDVVAAVTLHGVNEEEAEHLDPLWAEAYLFIEMLANGPPDHLPLNGCTVHIAPGFALPEIVLAARYPQFDERVPFPYPYHHRCGSCDRLHGQSPVRDRRRPAPSSRCVARVLRLQHRVRPSR